MEQVRSLNDVKIGDEFFVYASYSNRLVLVKCERVTPKRAVIAGNEYAKEDAKGRGGDVWHRPPLLYVVDSESKAKYAEQEARRAALEAIKQISGQDKTQLLIELHEIIKKHKP